MVDKIERSGEYVLVEFEDGAHLEVVGQRAEWKYPPPKPSSLPEEFFDVQWDKEHLFNFFEDDNGDALWASGDLSDEEFVRQANEYDAICSSPGDYLEPYTAKDVVTRFVHFLNDADGGRVKVVDTPDENTFQIKRIAR